MPSYYCELLLHIVWRGKAGLRVQALEKLRKIQPRAIFIFEGALDGWLRGEPCAAILAAQGILSGFPYPESLEYVFAYRLAYAVHGGNATLEDAEKTLAFYRECMKRWPRQYGYWYFALETVRAIVRHRVKQGACIDDLLALADRLIREKHAEGQRYHDLFPEMIATIRQINQLQILAHQGRQALSRLTAARRALLPLPSGYGKTQFEFLYENAVHLHPDEHVRKVVKRLYI